MKKQLCIKAVTEAWKNRNPESGIICHSDAGSQYTSKAYRKVLGQLHIVQSMSDVGKCYDNCRMESFFATLKKEKIYQMDTTKMTVEEVKKRSLEIHFCLLQHSKNQHCKRRSYSNKIQAVKNCTVNGSLI